MATNASSNTAARPPMPVVAVAPVILAIEFILKVSNIVITIIIIEIRYISDSMSIFLLKIKVIHLIVPPVYERFQLSLPVPELSLLSPLIAKPQYRLDYPAKLANTHAIIHQREVAA